MYKINKEDFQIVILKLDSGFKITVSRNKHKRYFSVVSGKVFIYEKDWILLDTSELSHVKKPKDDMEKGIFDLFKVVLLYPVDGKYLTLKYDESIFLSEITYDLYIEEDTKEILPVEEYTFKDCKLIYEHEGKEHFHLMPSSENLSEEEFIKMY